MKKKAGLPKEHKTPDSATLSLRILPRASRNEIVRTEQGGLKIKLTAPPVDGAANEALVRFLAGTLAVSKSQIEILSGHTSREKTVRIHGMSEAEARRVLKGGEE